MDGIEFQKWPSIPRLYRNVIVTEKIDGTNAAVGITDDGTIYAQSHTRIITPEDDNFGFARWVFDNAEELVEKLGPGLHFGAWYGSGIQRGYNYEKGVKNFALFNVKRWRDQPLPSDVRTVPVLYEGTYYDGLVYDMLEELREFGSRASAGRFDRPEGIIVFFTQPQISFKITCENDEMSKGEARHLALAA